MYITSVAFTQGVLSHKDVDTEEFAELRKYYGTLPDSIRTLFMAISGGVNWREVSMPLEEIDPMYHAIFIAYVAFVQVAVLNVVTGVFCENAIRSAANDEEAQLSEHSQHTKVYMHRLTRLFKDCETMSSGNITLRDFETKLGDPKAVAWFKMMDLEVHNALILFRLLDEDCSGLVSIEEFVNGCLELRGTAKSIDVARVLKTTWQIQKYEV
jgi:hypothetical protein